MYQDFNKLEVWKEARVFRNNIYALVQTFPKEEKYGLGDQIIRSSRSIGNNIAEGHGRYNYADNARFCKMARGSLKETLDHLIVAYDIKIINREELETYKKQYDGLTRLLNIYIGHLKKKNEEK